MAEELVSRWAAESFFKQFDDAIPQLQQVVDLIAAANTAGRNSEGLMKQASSLKEFSVAQSSIASAQDKLSSSFNNFNQVVQTTESWKARYNGSSKEMADLSVKLIRLNTEFAKSQDTIAKSEDRVAEATRKRGAAQAAAQIDPTSLKYLSDRLNDLRKGYERLTQSERDNAEIGGVLLARIKELDTQLKATDASQGKFNRNVGNYSGAVAGFKLQVTQIARELPSLASGWATFAIAIGNNLPLAQEALARLNDENARLRAEGKQTASVFKTLAQSIFSWQSALIIALTILPQIGDLFEKLANSQNAMLAVNQKAVEGYASQTTHLDLLRQQVEDASTSHERLRQIRDELVRQYPALKDSLESESDLRYKLANAINNVTEALKLQATVRAAEDLITEATKKRLGAELDSWEVIRGGLLTAFTGLPNAVKSVNDRAEKDYQDTVSRMTQIALKAQKDLDLSGLGNLLQTPDKPKKPKRTPDFTNEELKADKFNNEQYAKLQQERYQEDVELQRRIYEDTTKSLDERLNAYRNYANDLKLIQQQEAKAETDTVKNTLQEIEKIKGIKSSGGKLTPAQKKLLDQEQGYRDLLERLTNDSNAKLKKIDTDAVKDMESIRKNSIQEQMRTITEGLTDIANATSEAHRAEKDELQKQYDDGIITYKQFRTAYDKLNAQENNETIARQKEFAKNALAELLKEANVPPEVIAAIRAKLDALYDKPGKKDKTSLSDIYNSAKQGLSNAKSDLSIYEDQADAIVAINNSITQHQIANIDAEIAKINEKRDAEIAGIEASTLSEEDKQKRIAEVKAAADAQEKALEADKVARQRRAAQFEKNITIAEIIAETALATVRALGSKPYTPANIGLAAATAAIGFAKLAEAVAAPIPQYEHGTQGKAHPGGPARLFEGNKVEAVFEPGKKPWLGRMEGVYNLAKGAEVVSNRQLKALMQYYSIGLPALIPQQGGGAIDVESLRREMKGVKQAIENKPVAQLNVTGMGMQRLVKRTNSITEYIKNV